MKYHIWTEGCQMNVADSQRLASVLEQIGYQVTRQAEEADVIVLNTCVVRQSGFGGCGGAVLPGIFPRAYPAKLLGDPAVRFESRAAQTAP